MKTFLLVMFSALGTLFLISNVFACSSSYNCPDVYIQTSCSSCGVVERQYNYVPGHQMDPSYEVYYDDSDVYPTPYSYHQDWAYTLAQ